MFHTKTHERMKRLFAISVVLTMTLGLMAQETTVSVLVREDGKVVKDTTYVYDSAEDAEHAVRILSLVSERTGEDSDHECKHVKVMKVSVDEEGEHSGHGERVIIVKTGDGDTFDILLDEECEHEMEGAKVIKKEVKVIVEGDEDGEWNVIEKESDNDSGEELEVIVVKKKEQKISKKQ